MRDVVAHQYFGVDVDVIFNTEARFLVGAKDIWAGQERLRRQYGRCTFRWAFVLGWLGKERRAGGVLGALFFLAGHGLLHWAELHIASGLAAVLIAVEPLWILAIVAAMGRQRFNRANVSGLPLWLAGVALLTYRFASERCPPDFFYRMQWLPYVGQAAHGGVRP